MFECEAAFYRRDKIMTRLAIVSAWVMYKKMFLNPESVNVRCNVLVPYAYSYEIWEAALTSAFSYHFHEDSSNIVIKENGGRPISAHLER